MNDLELDPSRAAWLLVRLRVRRLLNMLGAMQQSRRRAGPRRKATSTKRGSVLTSGFLVVVMSFGFGSNAWRGVANLERALDARGGGEADVATGLALMVAVSWVAALFSSLGGRELATAEWDMEWLATLPMPTGTLVGARIVERSVTSPMATFLLAPLIGVIAWKAGAAWWTFPITCLALLPAFAALGAVQVLVDTGARMVLSPARLRNLQAVLSLLGAVALIAPMGVAGGRSVVADWVSTPSGETAALAGRALVAFVRAPAAPDAIVAFAVAMAEAAAVVVVAAGATRWLLRDGFVAGGAREVGRRTSRRDSPRRRRAGLAELSFLSPLARREIRLLSRDRNFFVQTLVLPLLIVGMQLFLNKGLSASELGRTPRHLCAFAFVAAAYALMFSTFQTLNAEGQALWLLYTTPRRLDSLLADKTKFWASIAVAYACAVMSSAFAAGGASLETVGFAIIVLVGVPIYATVAVSLGVFASDPLGTVVQRRMDARFTYLYVLLAAFYTYAIYAGAIWQRFALVVLATLLAIALAQKARDRLPFLLDPGAVPPQRVSLSDGIIAAMCFFVLQGVVAAIGILAGEPAGGRLVTIAFREAGALTFALVRYTFWRLGMAGVPVLLGEGAARTAGAGIAAGVGAGAFGVAYVTMGSRVEPLRAAFDEASTHAVDLGPWLFAVAIVAAPLFEEWIFRGLVFGGMRRTLGFPAAATASAAVFAIVHPPVSFVPVFVLALAAAWAYERTRALAAPILAHALYNAAVTLIRV